jgi:hypothetical protein
LSMAANSINRITDTSFMIGFPSLDRLEHVIRI